MRAFVLCVGLVAGLFGGSCSAATLTPFDRSFNGGVFRLNADQRAYFDVQGGTYIGFYGFGNRRSLFFDVGDTFDASTVLASCDRGCDRIVAVLNGRNAGLTYTGGYLDPLGTTTILRSARGYIPAIAFLFDGRRVDFLGNATFVVRGRVPFLDFVPPVGPPPAAVPVPAALPLLFSALAAMFGLGIRRRGTAAAI